jgi:hypothetical protein
VSLAVDAARQSADDDETGCRELAPQHPRNLRPVRRACPRADDSNRGLFKDIRRRGATEEECARRVVDLPQELG